MNLNVKQLKTVLYDCIKMELQSYKPIECKSENGELHNYQNIIYIILLEERREKETPHNTLVKK